MCMLFTSAAEPWSFLYQHVHTHSLKQSKSHHYHHTASFPQSTETMKLLIVGYRVDYLFPTTTSMTTP